LDRYFAGDHPLPDFLKIDVEGFEQNVIIGGKRLLQKGAPTVIMEMNHFCLDVLQRITIPDFLDFMRSVFPYLYAVDADNRSIVDLCIPDQAYGVMHEHVVNHRYPNIVGGFKPELKLKLDELAVSAGSGYAQLFNTPVVTRPRGRVICQECIERVSAGDSLEIPVTVTNEGDEIWHGYGDRPVVLGCHWMGLDGSPIVYNGERTRLQCRELHPGRSVSQSVRLVAPGEKGELTLIVTLVQEGVCWFEDQGFNAASWGVSVV
jgi:hypothetical protein